MSAKTVTVIIPAYNQGHYLGETIQSVLNQTYQDFELIIIDDGSTDNTREVANSFSDPRIRYIYQENGGLSAARNTGIRESSAPLVTFLDSDDLFLPHNLAVLQAYLEEHAEVGLVSGGTQIIDPAGRVLDQKIMPPANLKLPELLMGNPFSVGGLLLRRVWLERVGVFDESLRACEDWDLWLRLAIAGCQFAWVEQAMMAYRFHPAQMTREADRMRTAMLRVLDKFFSRSGLPAHLLAYQNQARASVLVKAAARGYRSGEFKAAQRDLAEAVRLAPTLADERYKRLVGLLTGWANNPQSSDSEAFLRNIYTHLPPALPGLRREWRRAMAAMMLAPLFQGRDTWPTHKFTLLKIVWYDPALLLNRGVLRMLIEAWLSVGGFAKGPTTSER